MEDDLPTNMNDKVAMAKLMDDLEKSGVLRGDRCLTLQPDIVAKWNEKILEHLQGELHTRYSADTGLDGSGFLPQELLRTLDIPSLPPAELHLKLGAPVMLLKDISPSDGLVNGSRLRLIHIGRLFIEVQALGGAHDGKKSLLPQIPMSSAEGELPWIITRRQFPIRLCFAIGRK